MTTPVLFLDLDDVLICPDLTRGRRLRQISDGRHVPYTFHKPAQQALSGILNSHPDCRLVLSSTWRREGWLEVCAVFRLNDADELIGRFHEDWATGDGPLRGGRVAEIDAWLAAHPEVTRAVAIDDDTSIRRRRWAVLVNPKTGLTAEDAARAIALLAR